MIAPGIYDLQYGAPDAVEEVGCGPFSAGKGALVTDGASAFFQLGACPAPPAPERVTRALRPLMARPAGATSAAFFELTLWLAQNFATCTRCARSATVCDHCTTRCGRIADVPVFGWHVRRQLSLVEHRPPRVCLAAVVDERGRGALHVSCERWTYIRMGLIGEIARSAPAFP